MKIIHVESLSDLDDLPTPTEPSIAMDADGRTLAVFTPAVVARRRPTGMTASELTDLQGLDIHTL